MAQFNPSSIYLAQASRIISNLQREFGIRQFKSQDELVEIFNKALTKFETDAGKSLTAYEPIVKSEVPNSVKINKFWNNHQTDLAILEDQVELLRAAVIDMFNMLTMDVKKARSDSLVSQNKVKTLQLYSNISDPSMSYFGDNFITEELIDWSAQSDGEERVQLLGGGAVGLGVQVREDLLDYSGIKIKILDGSNGFLGNNQELSEFKNNTIAVGEPNPGIPVTYQFKQTLSNPNDILNLTDSKPNTWIEFEKYWVDPSNKTAALNYNFNYKFVDQPEWAYLKPWVKSNNTINWADGFSDSIDTNLILNLEIDLINPQKLNLIELLPFGLEDNINHPILIKSVQISLDKTIWYSLFPNSVYLANSIDRSILDINAANVYVGKGSWVAEGKFMRFVRFEIVQTQSTVSNIGHHYYLSNSSADLSKPSTRVVGPVPPINDTGLYNLSRNLGSTQIVQKTEAFTGKRWAIGIRDIGIVSNIYYESSSFVSRKFDVGGIVDRVALEAEVEVPEDYDSSVNWIKFYISPNNGGKWYQISRIQDDFLDIPEVIAFNDPTPAALREPGVAYYDVNGVVNTLRFKAVIERPIDKDHSTPILRPYKLKIKRRI